MMQNDIVNSILYEKMAVDASDASVCSYFFHQRLDRKDSIEDLLLASWPTTCKVVSRKIILLSQKKSRLL